MKALKVIDYIVTFILLCLLMYKFFTIFHKFIAKDSFQTVNELSFDQLLPPLITLCPAPAYKTNGPYLTPNEFLKNKYTWEDIFHEKTLIKLQNDSLFKIKETFAAYYGICFTVQKLTKEKISDYSVPILLNNTIGTCTQRGPVSMGAWGAHRTLHFGP